jgi:peroxiredoxin
MRAFYRFATVFALAASAAGYAQAAETPKVGEPAPGFTLTSAAGNEHSLSDFKGKYVVLEWVNHGCPFVKKHYETGNMQATQKMATESGHVWLSICSSAPGKQGHMSAEKAAEKSKAVSSEATAYLLDENGKVGKAYGATRTPEIFIISPEGKIVYHGGIDDRPTARKSDVEGANNFVLAAMKSLEKGEAIANATTQPYGCSVKY